MIGQGQLIMAVAMTASLLSAITANAAPVVQAAIGEPFGVARITLNIDPQEDSRPVETNGYTIREANHRVFYPTFGHTRLLGAVRQLLGVSRKPPRTRLTVFFLFKGDTPFQVDITTPSRHTVVVMPKEDQQLFEQLRDNWWRQYVAVAELQRSVNDYPPIMETYLTSMLSDRLHLRSPVINHYEEDTTPIPQQSLLLVLNVESMRMKAMERSLLHPPAIDSEANLPIPDGIDWPKPKEVTLAESPDVEPMALRVPPECFYIRYGNFRNYLWAKGLLERHAGSVARLITLRGQDTQAEHRIQEQLGLRESALASVLGPQLISDIAMIGRDTYLKEGSSVGVVFESRNQALLQAELMKQRSNAVQRFRDQGAKIENFKMLNHTVSFASTADNRLRSFLVRIGNYHLVTNTKEIVRRFIEVCGKKTPSLGDSGAFKLARVHYPLKDDAAVFVYIDPKFFHGLVSPQYQIELRRRLMAVTQIELVQMARLAAEHEGVPGQSVAELRDSGLLPPYFETRADRSHVVFEGNRLVDSLRGARGTFLPIPDVEIDGVTPTEASAFSELEKFHEQSWSHVAPLLMSVGRKQLKKGREELQITAEMVPFEREFYPRVTSVIGPATTSYVHQSRGDAITVQASVQGGVYRPDINHHQMFFGIQDRDVPVQFASLRTLRMMQVLRTAPAYIGAHPTMGFLQALPLGTPPKPDDDGLKRLPFGLWQMSDGDEFSLIAFQRSVLLEETPDLSLAKDPNKAQLRIHVGDLTKSKIQTWFAALDFQRSYQASIGNTRLLHTMSQQLGVPPNEALKVAESILGVELICALGGKYDRIRHSTGNDYWSSNRWPERVKEGESPDAEFVSPIMGWFRGLDARMTLAEERLTGSARLEIEDGTNRQRRNFFDFLR